MVKAKPDIYIVDDNEYFCRALSRLMNSAGFKVKTFNSAQSFLNSVAPEAKGCLILDIYMRGMNGFELKEKMNTKRYNLHIIFITAHVRTVDRERATKGGAIGLLEKPFDDKSLLDLISSIKEEDTEEESARGGDIGAITKIIGEG